MSLGEDHKEINLKKCPSIEWGYKLWDQECHIFREANERKRLERERLRMNKYRDIWAALIFFS